MSYGPPGVVETVVPTSGGVYEMIAPAYGGAISPAYGGGIVETLSPQYLQQAPVYQNTQ